jgi:hypothetical protein
MDIIDQNKINQMLSTLYTQSFSEKTKILLEFNEFFTNKYRECVLILEKNIDLIIKSYTDLLRLIFSQPTFNSELIEMLKYLLTVFYKSALTKDVIEHTNVETVYNTFEEILKSILYEGLESVGQAEEGSKIIKSLNALILKLMENFNPTITFVSLIKLIQNYRNDNSRICSLSIKCLLKISNIMPTIINSLDVEKILTTIFEFIYDFEKTNVELVVQTQNEEMCIKILKTVIHEIIKIKNEGIWNYYKAAIEQNNLPDKHLKRWIHLIIRSKNGLSMPSIGMSGQSSMSTMTNNYSPMCNLLATTSQFNNINSANKVISFDNELKFYLDKLKFSNSNIDKEKLFCEVIAIIRRNKLSIEYLIDKLSEEDFNYAKKLIVQFTNNELANSGSFDRKINIADENSNYSKMTSNKIVTNFITNNSIKEKVIINKLIIRKIYQRCQLII